MTRYVLESFVTLLYFEALMRLRPFHVAQRIVEESSLRSLSDSARCSPTVLCHAIDLACVLYFKQVLCLQRSAAATVLLRRHGWRAEMVIGVQLLPFKSHAWVEVDGNVVNDRPYVPELYRVLKRC